jgi:cytochrome b6
MIPRTSQFGSWLSERLPVGWIRDAAQSKSVPQHKHSLWYYFGGLTLFFFALQVVTGLMLALYYQPTPEHAYESVVETVNLVPHGWFVRSLHSWSANILIALLFIHMFSAFLMKAYRKPRELMWLSGAVLLFLMLGFSFTGYLLPWDTTAYFATLIGTEVPKTMPLIGTWGVSLIKGGEEIGEATLTRMFSIHVIYLPLIALVIVSFHVLLNQVSGSSVPLGARETKPAIRFFPNYLYRDFFAWGLGLAVLLVLATMLPWGLGEKADPFASAPLGIRPEWYFWPLYETLRLVPSQIFSLNGELLVNLIVGVLTLFWFAIPFVDRRAGRGERSPVFTAVGVLLIAYMLFTIGLAVWETPAAGGKSGGPLRLPGAWDRFVVLAVGLIIIAGFVLFVLQLRRRADRRIRGSL